MTKGQIEHVNLAVSDIERSTSLFEELLGWKQRWRGPTMDGGETIHVGDATTYLALHTGGTVNGPTDRGALNHVGLLVDDLPAAERIVLDHGMKTFGHDDYDPGRRFYFFDWDGIEFEVVSYE